MSPSSVLSQTIGDGVTSASCEVVLCLRRGAVRFEVTKTQGQRIVRSCADGADSVQSGTYAMTIVSPSRLYVYLDAGACRAIGGLDDVPTGESSAADEVSEPDDARGICWLVISSRMRACDALQDEGNQPLLFLT